MRVIQAGEEHGDSAVADGIDECERIVDFEGLTPIEKLDRIEAAVAAKGFVDRRPRFSQPDSERPNG